MEMEMIALQEWFWRQKKKRRRSDIAAVCKQSAIKTDAKTKQKNERPTISNSQTRKISK